MSAYFNSAVDATLNWLKRNNENTTCISDAQVVVLFKNSRHLDEWCDKNALVKTRVGNNWKLSNVKPEKP